VSDNRALLIDFSFAVKIDEAVPYSGAITCAAPSVLRQLAAGAIRVKCTAASDLQSLVRAVLLLTQPQILHPTIRDTRGDNLSMLEVQWADAFRRAPALFSAADAAAEAGNYELVKAHFAPALIRQ